MSLSFVTVAETIGTTERSMVANAAYGAGTAQTTDCLVDIVADLTGLDTGDQFQLTAYEKVNGGTQRVAFTRDFVHGQSTAFSVLGLFLGEGWDVTLKKVTGTDRSCRVSTRRHLPVSPTLTPDSATIGSTRYSLTNDSTTIAANATTRRLQVWLDLSNLAAGDEFLLVVWDKVAGGSQIRLYEMPLRGAQSFLAWTPLVTVGEGWDVTLEKVSGTDRSIAWSLRTIDGTTYPQLSTATTIEAIRDRIIDVIAALTPEVRSGDRFRPYRNEAGANFIEAMEAQPAGALRRVQVRRVQGDQPPEVSSGVEEHRRVTFQITIAYPQTARYGAEQALDRDDVIEKDQRQIEEAVGLHGRANFVSPYPDACWRSEGSGTDFVQGDACDFLVITQTMEFVHQLL